MNPVQRPRTRYPGHRTLFDPLSLLPHHINDITLTIAGFAVNLLSQRAPGILIGACLAPVGSGGTATPEINPNKSRDSLLHCRKTKIEVFLHCSSVSDATRTFDNLLVQSPAGTLGRKAHSNIPASIMTLQSERHVKLDNQCNDVRAEPTNPCWDPFTGINRACYRFILLQYRGKRSRVRLQPQREQHTAHAVVQLFKQLASERLVPRVGGNSQNCRQFRASSCRRVASKQCKLNIFSALAGILARRLHHLCTMPPPTPQHAHHVIFKHIRFVVLRRAGGNWCVGVVEAMGSPLLNFHPRFQCCRSAIPPTHLKSRHDFATRRPRAQIWLAFANCPATNSRNLLLIRDDPAVEQYSLLFEWMNSFSGSPGEEIQIWNSYDVMGKVCRSLMTVIGERTCAGGGTTAAESHCSCWTLHKIRYFRTLVRVTAAIVGILIQQIQRVTIHEVRRKLKGKYIIPGSDSEPTRSRPGVDPESIRSRLGADPVSTGTDPEPSRSRPGTDLEPTLTRPGTDPESTGNRPGADPEPTRGRPELDPEPTLDRPRNDPKPTRNRLGADPETTRIREYLFFDLKNYRFRPDPQPTRRRPGADPESTRSRPGVDPESTRSRSGADPESTRIRSEFDQESTRTRPGTDPELTRIRQYFTLL
ncbi:hypothetical protein GEV33_012810 [Tenebrio molitor]|uniref:Uncharacterized protein n=1 Tax=Tenebrio molitor TaxID=7067 RepID=A0A8J6H950_TENMO|nr:hypothetical protein GEV33_012810 [Tenebrio molitor]